LWLKDLKKFPNFDFALKSSEADSGQEAFLYGANKLLYRSATVHFTKSKALIVSIAEQPINLTP
jgi:hypothetical protein